MRLARRSLAAGAERVVGSLVGLPALYCLAVLAGGCVHAAEEIAGTETSGFPAWDADFDRYREEARAWLTERAMPQRSMAEIALNLPFERAAAPDVPYRGRFLLFHGLNDSPAIWHDFADALVVRGYDVRAILFAGHGSTPEDMLDVEWNSWLETARLWLAEWLPAKGRGGAPILAGVEGGSELDGETGGGAGDARVPVYLGGFSMGGVIATLLALEESRLAGMLLVSPAYRSSFDRYLRFAGLYAHFRPWVFGGMILEDNPIKYNSIPVNSGWQFHRLTRALARRWRPKDRIDLPALVVLSSEDSVVDVDYTRRLFRRRFVNGRRLMITYAPDVREGGSPGIGKSFAEIERDRRAHEETRDSRHLGLRILGQSHLSLTNAPSNPLFGEDGRVLVCNGNEYPVFMACMRASDHWYGAQHSPSPDDVPVARTTWNPDWTHVLERFDEILGASGTGGTIGSGMPESVPDPERGPP